MSATASGSGKHVFAGVLAVLILAAGPALAGSPQDKFYKAHYLEQTEGDWTGAAQLYSEIVNDRSADAQLKADAQAGLARAEEELASADFASLMPPTTLAYIELRQPGKQLAMLLDQLGLLSEDGLPSGQDGKKFSISPSLIKELMGMRGAAVAITGFDPSKGAPAGGVVFHPGDMAFVRGLIETGLPVGTTAVEPINGFQTYDVKGEALVTLTSRLVIASPQRSQIEAVVRRLTGKDTTSLATDGALTEVFADRDDSLLFFCVNAKPLMPLINGMMAVAGSQNREVAIAQTLLDLNSLQSLVGHVGIGDDRAFLELTLRLDEGHKNLIYNLLRTPPVSRETLKNIPAGAAAFLAGALNETPSRFTSGEASPTEPLPIVTALDFGREIFANITSFAIFALPPEGERPPNAPPIPDLAAAISVNDPAKSEALWTQILGIASLANGASSAQGSAVTIEGVAAKRYRFPERINVYFATNGNDVLISSTKRAMASSIRARRNSQSILDDAAFGQALKQLGPDTTRLLLAHPGRCLEIARPFIPPAEAAWADQLHDILSRTVVSTMVGHSDNQLHVSAAITGIPDVAELVTQVIEEQARERERFAELDKAIANEQWDEALTTVDSLLAEQPGNFSLLDKKFDILTLGKKDHAAAVACGDDLFKHAHDNAKLLNNLAWALLTKDEYKGQYSDLALKLSERSNDITDLSNWAYLDTLAVARFETGDIEGAIELEKKAVDLSDGKNAEVKATLARFEKALKPEESPPDNG